MGKYNRHLAVSDETYNKIVVDCKKEFLKHNPDFKGMKLTHEFILNRLARKYLDEL
jgi:hypothetical protein